MRDGIYLIYELRCGTKITVLVRDPRQIVNILKFESPLSLGFWFICFSIVLLWEQYRKFPNHVLVVLSLRLCVCMCVCVCVCVLVIWETITLIINVKNI